MGVWVVVSVQTAVFGHSQAKFALIQIISAWVAATTVSIGNGQ